MSLTLLIDGDMLAYIPAAAAEHCVEWEPGEKTYTANAEEAKAVTRTTIEHLMEHLQADDAIVCLSDPTRRYWRHDVYPNYKNHRTQGHRPICLDEVKQYLVDEFKAKVKPGLEADDILGILATHPTLVEGEKIIVTQDKDLRTIPCSLYNYKKPEQGIEVITEQEADYNHLYQTLVGDTCDGFPGCPGIGPVKAKKALDGFVLLWPEFVWEPVVQAFQAKGLTEEDALVQARVARICRHTDYDFTEKKVKLWNPSTKETN